MKKIFSLVERGVSHEIQEVSKSRHQINADEEAVQDKSDDDDEIKLEEETGVEAGAKKKVKK